MNLMPWKKATRSVVVIAPRGAAQLQSVVALEKSSIFGNYIINSHLTAKKFEITLF